MPAVIGSNQAARIAFLARQKVQEKMLAKTGRNPRPFINFLDSRKKPTQFTGDGIMVGIKEIATNINAQKWSGTPTLQGANGIQNTLWAQFKSSNMFANTQWGYDDLRKASGVTILPNQNGVQTADERQFSRDPSSERVLYNRIQEDMESFNDRTEQLRDLECHRPGATTDDLVGLMGILPMSLTGQYGGIDRASNPAAQHILFAGAVTEQSGVPWVGARGTTGSSGTLLTQLEKFIRALRTAAFACGLPKGRWKLLGGSGFFDKLKSQLRQEKVAFNIDASSGESKLNLLITDERLGLSSPDLDLVLDFTLDQMDLDFASEIGLAPSQVTVAFSGGSFEDGVAAGAVITGSGPNAGQIARHAKGFMTVTAAGALDKLFVTDPGVGYVTAPTVTLANAGSGTGGGVSAKVYSTNTTSTQTVTADISTDIFTYATDIGNLTKVRFTTTGTLPTGVAASTDYWTIRQSATTCKVATSLANAIAGTAVDISSANGTGHSIVIQADAFTTVPSDDVRLGRVDAANCTVTAGSSYATTSTAAPATNRLYAMYEPSWEYLVQEGLDNFMSIPADDARARKLEQQWDHTHALTCNCPRVNGILVAD